MASTAGPLVPLRLPVAALRAAHRPAEGAAAAEEAGGGGGAVADGGGPSGRRPGTPAARQVSFSCEVDAAEESCGPAARESPASVRSQSSSQGLAWVQTRQLPISCSQKERVWFNSPMNSAHPVTPYAEVYGVHPRFFNFDRCGNKVSSCMEAVGATNDQMEKVAQHAASRAQEQAQHFAPQVNCTANYSYGCGQSYSTPQFASIYAAGFGQQWLLPDRVASCGIPAIGALATAGDIGYGYGYGLMVQQLLAAQRAQEVPAVGGLPRPR